MGAPWPGLGSWATGPGESHLWRPALPPPALPHALTQDLLLMDVLQPVQGLHEALHGPTALLPLCFQPVEQEVGEELFGLGRVYGL